MCFSNDTLLACAFGAVHCEMRASILVMMVEDGTYPRDQHELATGCGCDSASEQRKLLLIDTYELLLDIHSFVVILCVVLLGFDYSGTM